MQITHIPQLPRFMAPWKGKSIQEEKQKKIKAKEDSLKQKAEQREHFIRCKDRCVCEGTCKATGLKECPCCHNVLRSTCGKVGCRINGERPKMIGFAGEVKNRCAKKLQIPSDDSESSDDNEDDEGMMPTSEEEKIGSENEGVQDTTTKAIFQQCQESLFYCVYFDEGYYWGSLFK